MIKYILLFLIVFSTINIGTALKPELEYTDNIISYNATFNDTLYIDIPAGNIIDSIKYFPLFFVGVHDTYKWNNTYYINDVKYTNDYEVKTTSSLLHLYSSKYEYDIRQSCNNNLNYHKAYETYVSDVCYYPQLVKTYWGSYPTQGENIIAVENEVFSHRGIMRSTDHLEVFNSNAYDARNFTIQCDNLGAMKILITYKIAGTQTADYYICQLSPTLKYTYNLALRWLDKEYYILNTLIIADKLMGLIAFWLIVLAKSFVPILFIILTFVIPFTAYYNSYNRKTFVYNLTMYYSKFFNVIIGFMKFIIMIVIKFFELVRSLIPII